MFRVMKTKGFDIEAVPLRNHRSRRNLACATLIAAIQVQQMLHDRDGQAHRPMSDVFAPADQPLIESIGKTLEGKTDRQKNPHPSGSLAQAAWICARLGGWTGYGGKPGRSCSSGASCGSRLCSRASNGANMCASRRDTPGHDEKVAAGASQPVCGLL